MVRPRLSVLKEEQANFIHAHSLEILANVGVRVDSPRARVVLEGSEGVHLSGGSGREGPRATFSPQLVEWSIHHAPAVVEVFGRRGERAFTIGQDRARFGVGVTNLFYQDPVSDELARFTRHHLAVSTRLGDALPNFDLVSTIGVIQDYPTHRADLLAVLEMVANTTKPLVLLISEPDLFEPALDLVEALQPGCPDRPFAIPYLNPLTPLVLNEGTGDNLVAAVERGFPVIYSSFGMAGASTPITACGSLVLLNAELLAGLVVAQLTSPGAPSVSCSNRWGPPARSCTRRPPAARSGPHPIPDPEVPA